MFQNDGDRAQRYWITHGLVSSDKESGFCFIVFVVPLWDYTYGSNGITFVF